MHARDVSTTFHCQHVVKMNRDAPKNGKILPFQNQCLKSYLMDLFYNVPKWSLINHKGWDTAVPPQSFAAAAFFVSVYYIYYLY